MTGKAEGGGRRGGQKGEEWEVVEGGGGGKRGEVESYILIEERNIKHEMRLISKKYMLVRSLFQLYSKIQLCI